MANMYQSRNSYLSTRLFKKQMLKEWSPFPAKPPQGSARRVHGILFMSYYFVLYLPYRQPTAKKKVLHYIPFFITKIDYKGYFYLRNIFVAPLLVLYGMVARGLKC